MYYVMSVHVIRNFLWDCNCNGLYGSLRCNVIVICSCSPMLVALKKMLMEVVCWKRHLLLFDLVVIWCQLLYICWVGAKI